jgi:hypothetical protein
MKNLLTVLSLFLLLSGCKKEVIVRPEPETPGLKFTEFYFKAENNSLALLGDIHCTIYEDKIVGIIPYLSRLDSLIPTFTTTGAAIKFENKDQISDRSYNNFKNPVTYTITTGDGITKEYKVVLYQFTGVPIINVNTENGVPVDSKEDYRNASIEIIADGTDYPDYKGTTKIRGRGNSTWGMEKKPYRLKLDTKAPILGMPADKDWALLANYADKSLMRTKIAFAVSEMFGLAFTPKGRFAELFLNGEYKGSYFLTEHVKVASDRVDIGELKASDIGEDKITGGYLLEVDERLGEENWFYTNRHVPFCLKNPDTGIPEQVEYIRNYVQQTEDAIFSPTFSDVNSGYAKYIDAESFINWFWVNELFKNNDAVFHSSVFMYKPRGGKLFMGPVWDFDLSAGNINYNGNNNPEGWWVKQAAWITRLFEDPAFKEKAKAKWMEIRPRLASLYDMITETSRELQLSQRENFKKWDILNKNVYPNIVVLGSYANEVQYLKNWLFSRMQWIDNELAGL